ncbi:MAG: exosortase system-associated protein, TIGR04073 family [Methyloprofundus sp.]|nr:exosortase system-associated protein, TIGR04073 family [Methyloprofundus sp.]
MNLNKTIFLALLTSTFLCFSTLSIAAGHYEEFIAKESVPVASTKASYGRKIGQKVLRGLSNSTLSFFEIPKNMIMVTNQSNFLYGMTAGVALGALNTVGRTAVGINDFIFFLLPTKPVVYPIHPWNNYLDVETNYEGLFILDL